MFYLLANPTNLTSEQPKQSTNSTEKTESSNFIFSPFKCFAYKTFNRKVETPHQQWEEAQSDS